jgi:teichuronic acid biosynthesis glycosyltransferase TuaG
LSSVNNQSYKEWELIIGVNGYDENSEVFQKAKKYENDKIHVHDLFNCKGKSNSLNEMLKLCKYDWICILDVDDVWHKEKLEKQAPLIDIFDVIGTNCQYFGDSNAIPYIPLGIISDFDFTSVNPLINSSSLIKKNLCCWDSEYDGVEDYDLWLRLRKENKKIYNMVEILTFHRIHKSSAFNAKGNNNMVEELLKKYK